MALELSGFQIEREVGRGGMARVYLAVQKKFGRLVALKVVSAEYSKDPNFRKRFVRESRINAQLSHPNIVQVHDVGIQDNYLFLVMEYMRGGDLTARLNEGMHIQDLIQVTRDMSRALDFAHSKGFVHRDIKPENILFREDGSAVLTDFGIAKVVGDEPNITRLGTVVGTPQYMSPEQAAGRPLDGRSDIYSLGVVFYRMLSGDVPFKGDSAVAVGIRHLQDPIPRLPEHLQPFQVVIDSMLAKNPDDRYQNGAQVSEALDQVRSEGVIPNTVIKTQGVSTDEIEAVRSTILTAVRAEPAGIRSEPKKRRGKRRRPGILAGVGLVIGIVAFAGYVVFEKPQWIEKAIALSQPTENQATQNAWTSAQSLHRDPNQSLSAIVAGYRRVLTLDPNYLSASEAISGLAQEWKGAITKSFDADNLAEAETRLAESLAVFPDDNELALLSRQLGDRNRAEKLTISTRDLLLSHGMSDIPAANAAIQAYQEVLRLHPSSKTAREELDLLADHYSELAITAASAGDINGALSLLDRASAANSDWPRLQDVRSNIQQATSLQVAIEEMLKEATGFRTTGALINPEGANAAEIYHRILAADPDNAIAGQGLKQLEAQVVASANQLFADGKLIDLTELIDRSSAVGLNATTVNQLKTMLEGEQERLSAVAKLITQADEHFNNGYITEPIEANAVGVLREIIRLDPDNQHARSILVQSAELLASVAQEAYDANLVEQAKYYLDLALTVNPEVDEWRTKRDSW